MIKKTIFFFLILVLSLSLSSSEQMYDLVIKGAFVFDGSLEKPVKLDVAIRGNTIVKIAKLISGKSARIIQANGLYLSPGFIDLHSHVDDGMYFSENRACLNYLKQGVSTVVVGQCGQSAWPIFEKADDLIELWSKEGIGPNAALLVGHGTVREIAMGMDDRPADAEELENMKKLVKEAMEQGAVGFSTGLVYEPGKFSDTDEVIELVKVIAPYNGIYHTHIRNESETLLQAVEEAITIAKTTNVRTNISHFKVIGKPNWGLVKEASAMIEDARDQGLSITADQYPYRFSSNSPYMRLIPSEGWRLKDQERLTILDIIGTLDHLRDEQILSLYEKTTPYLPISRSHQTFLDELPRKRLVEFVASRVFQAAMASGPYNIRERKLFLERLKDPRYKKLIEAQIEAGLNNAAAPENTIIAVCVEKQYEGKSLEQIASIKGKSIAETAIELELMGAKCVPLRMCEPDIEFIMKKDYVATGSDGEAAFFGLGWPHIRSYSTFLHKIKKYGLMKKTVSIPHIIRSQTSLPADIMNWTDRGWIKEGYKADIVVFDMNKIQTPTSVTNPHQYSSGVTYLVINGKIAIENGEWTGVLPGKVLTRSNKGSTQ